MREFKSIEIDRYQRCNNTDGEPRNGAIDPPSIEELFVRSLGGTTTTEFIQFAKH